MGIAFCIRSIYKRGLQLCGSLEIFLQGAGEVISSGFSVNWKERWFVL